MAPGMVELATTNMIPGEHNSTRSLSGFDRNPTEKQGVARLETQQEEDWENLQIWR